MRIVILLISLVLVGCAPNTVTFMSPKGESGAATIDGCGQIPSTFQYKMEDAKYKIKLNQSSIYLVVEVSEGDEVQWHTNEMVVRINDNQYLFEVQELRHDERVREPCGGFTSFLKCKRYQSFYLSVKVEVLNGVDRVIITPPTPMVNNRPFKVSEIEYKQATKTLLQAINC